MADEGGSETLCVLLPHPEPSSLRYLRSGYSKGFAVF